MLYSDVSNIQLKILLETLYANLFYVCVKRDLILIGCLLERLLRYPFLSQSRTISKVNQIRYHVPIVGTLYSVSSPLKFDV